MREENSEAKKTKRWGELSDSEPVISAVISINNAPPISKKPARTGPIGHWVRIAADGSEIPEPTAREVFEKKFLRKRKTDELDTKESNSFSEKVTQEATKKEKSEGRSSP